MLWWSLSLISVILEAALSFVSIQRALQRTSALTFKIDDALIYPYWLVVVCSLVAWKENTAPFFISVALLSLLHAAKVKL